MPSKYRIILEMASQTARDIASNADRYTDFLITAANNYKYSFKEQLLIHAQKPDATACAEIDTWNKLGRWVNKGTKGIALLIDRDVPYTMQGDYLIPDLTVPESPKLGKYGMLRRTFLRKHRDGIYTGMLLNGTLNSHLEEVDRQAQKMLDDLTEQMKALNGVTEQLKAEDQMRWVQMMNSIRHSAEEVILNDLIYA